MDTNKMSEILEVIQEADMVLIGLGEEFDGLCNTSQKEVYEEGKKILMQSKYSSLVSAWQNLHRKEQDYIVSERLERLAGMLENKNYFVISVSTNSAIAQNPWREGRLVMPCGTDLYKQCSANCEENLKKLSSEERETLYQDLQNWENQILQGKQCLPHGLGECPKCKTMAELNNIYSEVYNENGYLPDWQNYTKWLQGTVNRKLVVLELGVGMKFPSVIRFPFEKIVYFNQKARIYRINKNLYHLTEELAGKGLGIADNAIDWLENLC